MESTTVKIHQDLEKARQQFHQELINFSKAIEERLNLKDDSIEYFNRLTNVGFNSVIGIQSTKQKAEEIAKNKRVKESYETILNHYKQNFPQYHIISLKDMITVCEKYGLIFGGTNNYKKLIPEKNLQDVEEFFCHMESYVAKKGKQIYQQYRTPLLNTAEFSLDDYNRFGYKDANLQITAPKNHFLLHNGDKIIEHCIVKDGDFDTTKVFKKSRGDQEAAREERRAFRRLLMTDPIIWVPIRFPMQGGACMIITKWGEEASYPEFANPIEN